MVIFDSIVLNHRTAASTRVYNIADTVGFLMCTINKTDCLFIELFARKKKVTFDYAGVTYRFNYIGISDLKKHMSLYIGVSNRFSARFHAT